MFINSLILAISSSIDSLGIGITYGIKNTKITFLAKIVLFIVAFTISIISIWFGNIIKYILPDFLVSYLGCTILILMGLFMCFQSLKRNNHDTKSILKNETKTLTSEPKVYSFFIKFLGITIKIIKNPNYSDLDSSNTIDYKEALFLGLALSLDSFCIGIGFGMLNISSLIFPLLISCFQLLFLSIGNYFGRKLYKFSKLPDNVWSLISGFLLISIGFMKIF